MLRHVLFDLSLFDTEEDRENSQKRVLWLLEALMNCNRMWLRQHPEAPLLYKSGVRYMVPEQFEKGKLPEVATLRAYLKKKGAPVDVLAAFDALADQCGAGEHFREIPRIIENGGGDCDNLAAWRAAELRELGIQAKPYITWRKRPDGGYTYHVIVLWPDGSSEDPSLLLGMGGEGRAEDRHHEEQKLGERLGEYLAGVTKTRDTVFGAAVTSTQDFNQFQYSIPFQTDPAYEDWSPTRPQAYYADPRFPNLPTHGGPIFNTRLRDPDEMDYEDREDRFDGASHGGHHGGHGGHGGRGGRFWGGGPYGYDYDPLYVVQDEDDEDDTRDKLLRELLLQHLQRSRAT